MFHLKRKRFLFTNFIRLIYNYINQYGTLVLLWFLSW
nr:MAG TPA: hypothetical protein [Caudoviricetes sp.]